MSVCLLVVLGLIESPILSSATSGSRQTRQSILESCQKRMISDINKYRVSRRQNLPALIRDDALCRAAQSYAEFCAIHGGRRHHADGRSPSQRARAAGYRGRRCGENVAYGYSRPSLAQRAWINSRGHRGNMLGPWRLIGVGAAKHEGRYFYVQMFGN